MAIVAAVIQNRNARFSEVDWSRILIYIAFLTSLAVAFTPTFDETSRSVARYLVTFLVVVLIWDMKPKGS